MFRARQGCVPPVLIFPCDHLLLDSRCARGSLPDWLRHRATTAPAGSQQSDRSRKIMKKSPYLLLAACCLANIAATAELSWAELVGRPDLWPGRCTARQAMKLQNGAIIPAGEKLNVLKFKANGVEVSTADGRTVFAAEPDETDVLAVAREAYAVLTPKQQGLTYELLLQRKDLWPFRVTLLRTLDLGGGRVLRQGDQLRLLNVDRGVLSLLAETMNTTFNFAPEATDFMAQARKLVEDENAGPRYAAFEQHVDQKVYPEGPVIGEMEGKLVNSITNLPEPLDPGALPSYIVFYRGSSTSAFTKGFTPTLVKYYAAMKPTHPEFEIVYLMTEPAAATAKFAKKIGFSWRAVSSESMASMPTTSRAIGPLLPQLIVMDRNGNVLVNGMEKDALTALERFDALLNQTRTRN